MNTTGKTVARLLPLLVILAVLPFSIWSCTKAGDEPDGPTGPASQYNPEMDTPGAKIAVYVESGVAHRGVMFALSAAFTDGDGRPVQGIPLTVWAETGTGAVAAYFSFEANPNITDEQGRISTHITPTVDCPNGSYRFVVSSAPGGDGPVNGPFARGYGGVYVGGVVLPPSLDSVTVTGPVANVELDAAGTEVEFTIAASTTGSCSLVLRCDAVGAGLNLHAVTCYPGINVYTVTAVGTLNVTATGYCAQTPTTTLSDTDTATVVNLVP